MRSLRDQPRASPNAYVINVNCFSVGSAGSEGLGSTLVFSSGCFGGQQVATWTHPHCLAFDVSLRPQSIAAHWSAPGAVQLWGESGQAQGLPLPWSRRTASRHDVGGRPVVQTVRRRRGANVAWCLGGVAGGIPPHKGGPKARPHNCSGQWSVVSYCGSCLGVVVKRSEGRETPWGASSMSVANQLWLKR